MTPAIIVVGVVALVGGLIYAAWAMEKKRTEAMRQTAMSMGFSFAESDEALLAKGFPLFDRGYSQRVKNVMTGKTGGRPVTLVDFQYTISTGKSSHTHRQSVAIFETSGSLPDFELSPENILHRFASVFGYQDIDFEHAEEFSKRYLLRGKDEAAVRAVFTPDVMMLLAGATKWSVETRNGSLAVFRAGSRCDAQQTAGFLAECARIAGAFGRA